MTERRFYSVSSTPTSKPDYHAELLASLERINALKPPVHTCSTGWRFAGLYRGPTSIACLFFRLSRLTPSLEFKQQSMLDWAEAYLTLSAHIKPQAVTAQCCGVINETLASLAIRCAMTGDDSLIRQLCTYEALINDLHDDGSNEWLYGRAGYLYLLRMVRELSLPYSPRSKTMLDTTIEKTIERILKVPQPWLWHSKPYIGACHGTIGIVTQILQSDSTYVPRLTPITEHVLSQQLSSGNFPPTLELKHGHQDDRLVQFCHGATGFVISLQSLLSILPSSSLAQTIKHTITRARECIYQRGLLTKSPSLCHGIAGNALAFVDTGDRIQKYFDLFLAEMTSEKLESRSEWMIEAGCSDEFVGLYGGEAGRAWVWAVAAQEERQAVLIGYNDI